MDSVLIRTAAGVLPERVASRLRSLADRYPGLTVGDRHDLALSVDDERETNEWLFRDILAAIVFVFTAIAVAQKQSTMIGLHLDARASGSCAPVKHPAARRRWRAGRRA